jgi:hypothetical protein
MVNEKLVKKFLNVAEASGFKLESYEESDFEILLFLEDDLRGVNIVAVIDAYGVSFDENETISSMDLMKYFVSTHHFELIDVDGMDYIR